MVLALARDAGSTFLPSEMSWAHLLTPALEEPVTAAALQRRIEAMHGRELRLLLAGYHVRWFRRATPAETIASAVDGDERAVTEFVDSSYPWDTAWQASLRALLPLSAGETRRKVLAALREIASRLDTDLARLSEEVAGRRSAARYVSPRELLRAATGGWEPVPEPGIEALVLVPTLAGGAGLHIFNHGATQIVVYGLAGASVRSAWPSDDLARLARAIGDKRRLRIMRLLSERAMSAATLAATLGISLTTLVHHLEQLRAAGAILRAGDGRGALYSTDPAIAQRMAAALERYLGS